MLFALLACARPPAPPPSTPTTLHIVAMNDWHGALYEMKDHEDPSLAWGGLPWLVGAVEALRAVHPDLILLDGGDAFQGTWPINASRGQGAVDAFSLLGVDAAAVGNHEFDYGGTDTHPLRGALMEAGQRASFSWLTANITEADGSRWQPEGFASTAIIERSGVKLGVIGLSTTDTPQTTLPRNVADLRFVDPVASTAAAAAALEAAGVDAIAVVGHLTGSCAPADFTTPDPDCRPDGEIGRLLDELPPGTIDVMVVGHAHTLLAQRVDDTFILEGRSKGRLLGQLELVVGPDGVDADASRLLPHLQVVHTAVDPGCTDAAYDTAPQELGDHTVTPSLRALALVGALEEQAGSLCDEIGCATAPLGRSRQGESEVGDFVADAMLAAFPQADLAIQNAGGLRADLPAGVLRREHMQAVMPFDNSLYLVELTGAEVERLLRIGSSGRHGLLQIAGGRYRLDPERSGGDDLNGDGQVETWETDRLCWVEVGGAALDLDETYTVVTTDFLYDGGDHLGPALTGAPIIARGPLLREALFAHTAAQTACIDASPSEARIEQGPCN